MLHMISLFLFVRFHTLARKHKKAVGARTPTASCHLCLDEATQQAMMAVMTPSISIVTMIVVVAMSPASAASTVTMIVTAPMLAAPADNLYEHLVAQFKRAVLLWHLVFLT